MRPSLSALVAAAVVAAGCVAPEGSAIGRVTWAGTAEGEGITVTLVGPETRAAMTDLEGNWHVTGLTPGHYAVVAEAAGTREGRVSVSLDVTDRHQTEAEPMTFTRVGALRGVVTRGGATDHAGISVMVVGAAGSAVTAADGAFDIEGVPTGLRDLVAFAPGYEKASRFGLDVQRGRATLTAPFELTALVPGEQTRGALRGKAWMPGTDDHSGIAVRITGTSFETTTATDGTFALTGVPAGVVTLTFRKDDAAADLARVLVTAGGDGFIIDKGLYDLGLKPVPLRRGKRVLDATAGVSAVSPGGAWTALQTANPARLWLLGPDNAPKPVTIDGTTLSTTPGFQGGAYWFTAYDARAAEYSLNRVQLPDLSVSVFARMSSLSEVRIAALPSGVAWIHRRTLNLRASASAPVKSLFEAKASSVVSLNDDTVLVAATTAVHHVSLDGMVLASRDIPTGADWVSVSPDRRWAVVGSGGIGGQPVALPVSLYDRVLQQVHPLPSPCYSAAFSPESDVLACDQHVHRLAADGTFRTRYVGPHFSSGAALWLGNGRVVVGAPPQLRIVAPAQEDIVVDGFTYDSLALAQSADKKRVRLLAKVDPATGLGQALEVTLDTGAVRVLAEGVASRPFLANERGVLVGRPRSVGTDLDLWFIPDVGPEVPLGRSSKAYGSYLSSSAAASYFGARRFAPGRGYESVVLDTRASGGAVVPLALAFAYDRWLDDRRLLQSVTGAAPFSDSTGLYLMELP